MIIIQEAKRRLNAKELSDWGYGLLEQNGAIKDD